MKRITAQRRVAHSLLFAFLLIGVALAAWMFWPKSVSETAQANKSIEIEAVKEKNPAKCDRISGDSYIIDQSGDPVSLDESDARKMCRQNIREDVVPAAIRVWK